MLLLHVFLSLLVASAVWFALSCIDDVVMCDFKRLLWHCGLVWKAFIYKGYNQNRENSSTMHNVYIAMYSVQCISLYWPPHCQSLVFKLDKCQVFFKLDNSQVFERNRNLTSWSLQYAFTEVSIDHKNLIFVPRDSKLSQSECLRAWCYWVCLPM